MSFTNLVGIDEDLPVTHHNEYAHVSYLSMVIHLFQLTSKYLSVYPAIDPAPLFASQPYKGKVVLVTGASRGIGQETAIQYARAGASIALVARTEESLTGTTDLIVSAAPGAEVLALAADVREAKAAEAAVRRVLERFGKLDVLIANAGSISVLGKREKRLYFPGSCKMIDLISPSVLDEKDPDAWWKAFEVNIRGTFNFVWCGRTAAEMFFSLRAAAI